MFSNTNEFTIEGMVADSQQKIINHCPTISFQCPNYYDNMFNKNIQKIYNIPHDIMGHCNSLTCEFEEIVQLSLIPTRWAFDPAEPGKNPAEPGKNPAEPGKNPAEPSTTSSSHEDEPILINNPTTILLQSSPESEFALVPIPANFTIGDFDVEFVTKNTVSQTKKSIPSFTVTYNKLTNFFTNDIFVWPEGSRQCSRSHEDHYNSTFLKLKEFVIYLSQILNKQIKSIDYISSWEFAYDPELNSAIDLNTRSNFQNMCISPNVHIIDSYSFEYTTYDEIVKIKRRPVTGHIIISNAIKLINLNEIYKNFKLIVYDDGKTTRSSHNKGSYGSRYSR